MGKRKDFYRIVEEVCAEDSRYKADAYEFVMQALYFTQNKLKRDGHVSGAELLEGIREFIIEQYGPMAKAVLGHWGINKTDDFGNIVFNLINHRVLSKTEADSSKDFKDGYDFEVVFANVLGEGVI